jgi:hypothetical protein
MEIMKLMEMMETTNKEVDIEDYNVYTEMNAFNTEWVGSDAG